MIEPKSYVYTYPHARVLNDEQRQLTVNLSKTKVVVFEARRSEVCNFMLSGAVVERVESYKYLGFVFHATKKLTVGTDALARCSGHGGYRKEGSICYETAMCTSGHTRSSSAAQAI